MTRLHRQLLGVSLWVSAVLMMTSATVDSDLQLAGWAILVALGACVFTGWLLLEGCRNQMLHAIAEEEDKIDRLVGAILGELGKGDRPTIVRD